MPAAWQGTACRVTPDGPSRVYVGVDGVMVPMVTTTEKQLRASRRRRCRGPKRRRGRQGHRERYKEFKLAGFYDQDKTHRHVMATGGNPDALGRVLRRDGRRFGIAEAAVPRGTRMKWWGSSMVTVHGLPQGVAAGGRVRR